MLYNIAYRPGHVNITTKFSASCWLVFSELSPKQTVNNHILVGLRITLIFTGSYVCIDWLNGHLAASWLALSSIYSQCCLYSQDISMSMLIKRIRIKHDFLTINNKVVWNSAPKGLMWQNHVLPKTLVSHVNGRISIDLIWREMNNGWC